MSEVPRNGRLWEVDHPYYCNEGNFFKAGLHHVFPTWEAFIEGGIGGNEDHDHNLLVRWDWKVRHTFNDAGEETGIEGEYLYCVWLIQRKGFTMSSEVPVTRDMEETVRAWLAPRAAKVAELWAPLEVRRRLTCWRRRCSLVSPIGGGVLAGICIDCGHPTRTGAPDHGNLDVCEECGCLGF